LAVFLEDIDHANEVLKLAMDVANNERKWCLKGYKSSELFEKFNRPNLKPLPKELNNMYKYSLYIF